MNYLKPVVISVEATVIAACATAAYQIATAHGGDILACAPIATIAAMECLRVPLAMSLPRLKFAGISLCLLTMAAITPLTFEGMSLAFEQFMHQRVIAVARAQQEADKAKAELDDLRSDANRRDDEIRRLMQQLAEARQHHQDIAGKQPTYQALPKSQTCNYVTKKGARISYDCSDKQAMDTVAASNADAQKAHREELEDATSQVGKASGALAAAQAKPAPDMRKAEADLAEANRRLTFEKMDSVMHRAAAAWFNVPVEDLTSAQFETFKKWAMYGLAGATATITMFAGLVSSMPERDGKLGKVFRAIRGMALARRKKLRTIVPTIKEVLKERLRIVLWPVDPKTGTVIGDPNEYMKNVERAESVHKPDLKIVPKDAAE
jgi:hypothetical protein